MAKLCPNIMGMPALPGAYEKVEGAFDGWESEAFDGTAWYAKGFDAGGLRMPAIQVLDESSQDLPVGAMYRTK